MNASIGSRRIWAYGMAVAVLVGLNVWRWWPEPDDFQGPSRVSSATEPGEFRAEDFRVAARSQTSPLSGRIQRNPFTVGKPPKTPTTARKAAPKPRREAAEPSLEALAAARVQAERREAREALGQFKVAAIRLDDGRRQALMLNASDTYVVVLGDLLGKRYRVDDISFDAVRLTDTVTRVSEQIPLTGN